MPRKKGQKTEDNPKRNWCYKVKAIVEGDETPESPLNEQMVLARRYANKLIEIERRRREEMDDAVEEYHPGWKAIKAEYAAAAAGKEEAKRDGDRVARKAALDRFTKAKAAYDPVKLKLFGKAPTKAQKERGESGIPGDPNVKAVQAPIDAAAADAVKLARDECGCYSGSYCFVEGSLKGIHRGAPPDWRRGYDRSVAVQFQKGKGKPVMTWQQATSCRDTRFRVEILPLSARPTHSKAGKALPQADPNSRRSQERQLALVWFRIKSEGPRNTPVWVKLLVHIHRVPPADAVIKWAYLHRRLVGRRTCYELMLTLSRPSWDRPRGDVGTVDVSIPAYPQLTPDGLLVATATGSDCAVIPPLVIPHAELSRWDHLQSLQERRDDNFNAARERLADWFKGRKVTLAAAEGEDLVDEAAAEGLPAWICGWTPNREPGMEGDSVYRRHLDARYVRRWRSPDRLSTLVWYWKDHRFPADRTIYPILEAWRRGRITKDGRRHGGERHYHDWQDAERQKACRWRDEQLRRFADRLARCYRTVQLMKIDYAQARRIKVKGRGRKDERDAKFHASIASPGRLARFIREAFGNDVVEVKHGAMLGAE